MSSRLIAHQIIKTQHCTSAEVALRDELLPANSSIAGSLMTQMRQAIAQRNPQAGRFKDPDIEQPAMQRKLVGYINARSDEAFVEFSRGFARMLKNKMAEEALATGGYLLFDEYEHGGETLLLVVLLSTHAQPWFDDGMNLQSASTLDFDHLRHGARFRYSSVEGNDDGVVQFVSRTAEGVSNYFQSFLGCEPITDSSAQGRYLHSTLRRMAADLRVEKDDLLQRAYSYWQDCRKNQRMMTMTSLANTLLPDDPRRAMHYLSDPTSGIAGEFSPPPPKVMKDYVKFEFNESGLKLAFERDKWLDNLTVKDRTVTIRNAPASLIEQIKIEKT